MVMPLYLGSVLVAVWVTVDVPSATAVTVTLIGVLQFEVVNTSGADTVTLPIALLAGVTVT